MFFSDRGTPQGWRYANDFGVFREGRRLKRGIAGSTMVMDVTLSSGMFDPLMCSDISNTYHRVNKDGKFVYIKYHFIAKHGQKNFTEPEAIRISGEDPDYSKRDLWETIEAGEEVEWTAKVQVMQPEEADPDLLGFDPFDVTKVWPRGQFPVCCRVLFTADRDCLTMFRCTSLAALS